MTSSKHISSEWPPVAFEASYVVNNDFPVPVLKATFFDESPDKNVREYEIYHSHHSFARSVQRGFKAIDLLNVLEYGEQIERQGMVFHIINARNLPQDSARVFKNKWQEWVVVTNPNQSTIITCYKAKGALKRIKRKVKSLLCNVK
jgi:RNA polymerase subunit RPABC4/transcription elongation factor Spt4